MLTVFREDAPVDWSINGMIYGRLAATLSRRYTIVPTTVEPQQVLGSITLIELPIGSDRGTSDRLKQVVKPGRADAIVVAQATVSEPTGGGARVAVIRNIPFVALSYRLAVFDGQTLEPIAGQYARIKSRPPEISPDRPPDVIVDVSFIGQPWANFHPSRKEAVRRIISQLADESVPFTLKELGMID